MTRFAAAYARLNKAQREAVDYIDGPLLVIAGPGTGKTQLLSARVANILQKTDTLPQNILCLTFTESGAHNMRDRLTQFIGPAAYDVAIDTYHAFGGDLITRFPEYFTETHLQRPVDELGRHQILQNIVENLRYDNPLKQVRHHLGDLIATVSEVKRALLSSDDLRAIASENSSFITAASDATRTIFSGFTIMPRKIEQALPLFAQTYTKLQALLPVHPASQQFGSVADRAIAELAQAITDATETNKTTPLTKWKNAWLAKDETNAFIVAGGLENRRVMALADIFEQYQARLVQEGWYDFDDMIIRAIDALANHPDLRFTLQEQYLYVMLDEFQDTNAAQLRLITLLTDNPVNEGRPNIMAVGDDDQAIYAFQGAQYSNMLDFYHMFRDVQIVNLTENYRSHGDILYAAQHIASQIDTRLMQHFEGMSKTLVASRTHMPQSKVTREEFSSDIAQNDWVATHVTELIQSGTLPHEIAVLAPNHKYLTAIVPYINAKGTAVRYERRENILEAPIVKQLLTMSKLVLALAEDDEATASALWPEVLSFPFWQIPVSTIWQVSWDITDSPPSEKQTWSKALLNTSVLREPALLFLTLAHMTTTESCEMMLDYLIGSEVVITNEQDITTVRSPLRAFYTGTEMQTAHPEQFYDTLSHLTVLRAKLRDHQETQEDTLRLVDLMAFVAMYEAAGERMVNTSPYNQQADAVQLMTVFKAKGLEFEHVFLLNCQDEVWGSSARGNTNKLTLPPNLAPIRHAGTTEDERLRLLFVAITRAKFGLYLTSSAQSYTGKATRRLKYLDEEEQEDGSFKAQALPAGAQVVHQRDHTAPTLALLELDWRARHIDSIAPTQLAGLLSSRLENYQLSPTHLNSFTDMEYGGPAVFFFNTLLRFPQAPSINSQFGNAVHETIEWIQHRFNETGNLPAIDTAIKQFELYIRGKKIMPRYLGLEIERGTRALRMYMTHRGHTFRQEDKAEYNFKREGVLIGDVHMSGKIDRMEINQETKTIVVIDYKTGSSYKKWERTARLHKYAQQLYCYKLLIEGSHTFQGYTVTEGRLEFIEPDHEDHINTLTLQFKEDELARTKQLLQTMWEHVMQLRLPDTTAYPATLAGSIQFEEDLLEGRV